MNDSVLRKTQHVFPCSLSGCLLLIVCVSVCVYVCVRVCPSATLSKWILTCLPATHCNCVYVLIDGRHRSSRHMNCITCWDWSFTNAHTHKTCSLKKCLIPREIFILVSFSTCKHIERVTVCCVSVCVCVCVWVCVFKKKSRIAHRSAGRVGLKCKCGGLFLRIIGQGQKPWGSAGETLCVCFFILRTLRTLHNLFFIIWFHSISQGHTANCDNS